MDNASPIRAVVVDDSATTRRMLAAILKDVPVEIVAEGSNATEACEACQREQPDLLFLDVVMPGENGVEVLRQIRDLLPSTRVVMVTSIAERDTVSECRDLGATGYILKPFSREKVIKTVRSICARIADH